nr:cobalt-precorrin-6A reductase [Oceaniglobus indicus]
MRLLLLAGTREGRDLAEGLRDDPAIHVIASLAGATRAPRPMGVATRSGGFGGRQGFADYLAAENIDAVLDATHPFAARMSQRTFEVCTALKVPLMQVLRPAWVPGPHDRWTQIDSEEEAAAHIPRGARVFVATGRQTLERFGAMAGRRMIVRVIDTPDGRFPFADGRFLHGNPPFSVDDEMALFRALRIDWLVVKNAGGAASRSKLDAARLLGVPVAMIRRPAQPLGRTVETVAAALDWARTLA